MSTEIVNKVKNSSLQTIKLDDYLPQEADMAIFDLKDFLFMEQVLREKDFRATLKELDWSKFKDKFVGIHCSTDALIPTWAYMLVSSYLSEEARGIFRANLRGLRSALALQNIERADFSSMENAKVVVKGCGSFPIDESVYVAVTLKLKPLVSSLMFGEPCSTVPIYKKRK